MAQVELRETGGGALVFNFLPDPKVRITVGKFIDYDEIPFQRKPEAYDAFAQSLRINLTGQLDKQSSSESADSQNLSIREVFMYLRGFMSYNNTGTITAGTEKKYTLRVKHPDSDGWDGTDFSDFEVILESLDFEAVALHWDFKAVFREVNAVVLI